MKQINFFIDSLGGGGAERVVSLISNHLVKNPKYEVNIVMLRKCPIAYELAEEIKVFYAEDLSVTTLYGKIVRRIYSIYKLLRVGIVKPLMKKAGVYGKIPQLDETRLYLYAKYAMPYREFLRKQKDATAFGFLVRSNICMLMAAKGTGVKTVFCERNAPVRPDIPKNIIRIRDEIYKYCHAAVFQTDEEREYYIKLKCDTAIIPNPIKTDLPERYEGERKKEIINFCRMTAQKNLKLLIDAFELLLKNYPDYTLRIYGKGPERDNLQEYIYEKKLNESVFLEDFASNIHEIICDAAMFVSTSDYEGLSNSMIEAMAIGMPCVCTDCAGGGARMMIQDHENGILVPIRDVQAVYNGMIEIIENKGLEKKLSINATDVKKQLSIEKIVAQWEKMI